MKEWNKVEDKDRKEKLVEIDERGLIDDVFMLAKKTANPVDSIMAWVNGEKIYTIEDGIVKVVRMPLAESEQIKKDYKKDNNMWKLDHKVPLQMGGLNNKENLHIVSTDVWATYTPIENQLTAMIKDGYISRAKAARLMKDLKSLKMTVPQVYAEMSKIKYRQ